VTRFLFVRIPRGAGRLLVWILAVLLPLQAAAASALAARGPLHIHRAPVIVVLEDVRRMSTPGTIAVRHVATVLGHFHAGLPERHRHALDDASVVAIDDGGTATLDGGATLAVAAFVGGAAPPAARFDWSPTAPTDVRATHDAWTPRTHDPAPPERPPRHG